MLAKKKDYKSVKIAAVAILIFLLFLVAKYVRVADEMEGTGAANGWFAIWDGKWSPGRGTDTVSGHKTELPLMMGSNERTSVSYLKIALSEALTQPFYFKGLVLSHLFWPSLVVSLLAGAIYAVWWERKKIYHQDAAGAEGGTAKWMEDFEEYNRLYVDDYESGSQTPDNNMIIADGLKLSMDIRKTRLNLNVLVIGGSGTGKTRFLLKPNLAQMNCSYIVTDPSGEIMQSTGKMLLQNGYKVKLFSTSDMAHTNVYNPMDYIYEDNGAISDVKVGILVSTFITNATNLQKRSGGDPFWIKASTACLTAFVLYLAECRPIEERNMYNALRLAQLGKADERPGVNQTELDKLFEEEMNKNPKAKFISSYRTFKLSPAKTANSILISLAVDLNPFSIEAVRNMTTTSYVCERDENGLIKRYIRDKKTNQPIRATDNLDISTVGDEKTALFVDIPQTNGAYNFLVSMMYSQMFDELYSKAKMVCPNRYHIYDKYGQILSSEYTSEEEAKRWIGLYAAATVRQIDGKFYLYNEKATAEETIPELAALSESYIGYFKEVYSEEVGKRLIRKYQQDPADETEKTAVKKKDGSATVISLNRQKNAEPQKSGPYIKRGALRLPVHVRFLLDEFSNIGEIPDFDKMLSTVRKYEISCTIILQSLTQIKAKYDKIWEVLVGNCDVILFLGSSENETDKYISEKLGKATIRTIDSSISQGGSSGSQSTQFKKQARDLLDAAEIGKINNNYCIVCIRSLDPIYKKKVDWEKCEHYPETGDADISNMIDMDFLEKYYKCSPKQTVKANNYAAINNRQRDVIQNNTTPSGKRGLGQPAISIYDEDSLMKGVYGFSYNNMDKEFRATHSVDPQALDPTDISDPEEAAGNQKYPVKQRKSRSAAHKETKAEKGSIPDSGISAEIDQIFSDINEKDHKDIEFSNVLSGLRPSSRKPKKKASYDPEYDLPFGENDMSPKPSAKKASGGSPEDDSFTF